MKILLLGGTGLIGKQVLLSLVFYPQIKKVIVWARNSQSASNPNVPIEVVQVNWEDFQSGKVSIPDGLDAVFCCLGTTINKAGSQEKFKEIDYEYPLLAAKQAKTKKVPGFYIITAMGSDSNSSIFYNRVKGEIETELRNLQFPFLGIFRPSLLIGEREEVRVGEKVGEFLGNLIPFGLLGLKKYKPIPGEYVAKSMIHSLLHDKPEPNTSATVKIYENDVLWEIGKDHSF
ncbi:NAD-dependent epimerase/dehydratase family protein [Leptospira perdikensis]|uniref:Nucleoside-diphosphate sugar epimerase n=1 Tax=Leptospira perdikensis TaxID=2484948 RepID=A0A4V3JNN2_9LEPT|nr:NAD-dependent epimerase/dehydratase family protein [Leptospira perdikensis]TGL35720.1 nucleoside-diphosphate sugar epimerase [Leptospira perdikensis]